MKHIKPHILKKTVFRLTLTAAIAAAAVITPGKLQAQVTAAADTLPHLSFVNKVAEVDSVTGNIVVSGDVKIVNTGKAPLFILRARGDCTCTTVDFPKEAIAPGDTATITVNFDTRGKSPGRFKKMVRIRSNADNSMSVAYIAGVIKKSWTRQCNINR